MTRLLAFGEAETTRVIRIRAFALELVKVESNGDKE